MLSENDLFFRMQERGELRVIEVSREFFSELLGLLQPEERWMNKIPGDRTAFSLWTVAVGNRKLLFTVKP